MSLKLVDSPWLELLPWPVILVTILLILLLELSHFMSLLPVIENSDLIATVPRDLADVCCRYGTIRIVDAPIKSPVIAVHQFWHRRLHKDPANLWLRGMVQALFAAAHD